MSIYNVAGYGSADGLAGDYYGEAPKLTYSVYPFRAIATDYTQVFLTWTIPAGDYSDIRLVRSFDGYPETQEDGVVIWSWDSTSGLDKLSEFTDGLNSLYPLIQGRFVYYRVWVKSSAATGGHAIGQWIPVGDTNTLLPARHSTFAPDGSELVSTQNKLMDVLPRVFTSATQSPIDEVDTESDLSKFLDSFAFELDRIQTYADLLLPLESGRLASADILLLQSLQLGLPIEPYLATKQQRRLAREALYIYQNKGTENSLGAYVESLTGFAPDITASPNLVLTPQDSSFTGGLGFWKPIGDITLELNTTMPGVPPETEPFVDDYRYTAKVVVNAAESKISSGVEKPITQGIPVVPGTPYIFSGYGKTASGTMNVGGHAYWYDYKGNLIRIVPPLQYPPVKKPITTDWTRYEFLGRAPGVEQKITSVSVTSNVATITVDPYNVSLPGETFQITGVTEAGWTGLNGYYQVIETGAAGTNWLKVKFTHANTTSPVPLSNAMLIECEPDYTATNYVAYSAVVTTSTPLAPFNLATVTIADPIPHGLSVGDQVVMLAFTDALSFGLHEILSVDVMNNTISFATLEVPGTYTALPGVIKKLIPGTGTPTPKGYYGAFDLVFHDTGTAYLDLFQMATFDVQEFHEARAVEIFLNPTKSNFLKNPGFNPAGASSWGVTAASHTVVDRTTVGRIGSGYALQVGTTVAGATSITSLSTPVKTGKYITASVWAKAATGHTETMSLNATAYDVTSTALAFNTEVITITDKWQRFHTTFYLPTVPQDAAAVLFTLAGATTGSTIYLDQAQVENSYNPTDYIVGDMPAFLQVGAVWEGDAYDSATHLYPGLPIKITRLQQELPKYLPINSSFLIRSYDGSQPYGNVAKPIR